MLRRLSRTLPKASTFSHKFYSKSTNDTKDPKIVPQFTDFPYKSDKEVVKKMAKTLLFNIRLHLQKIPILYQEVLVNSSYCGTGSTRLGIEFITQWKMLMNEEPLYREELERRYSPEVIKQLENSKILYINCKHVPIRNNNIEFERLCPETPYLIILDEIDELVSRYNSIPIMNVNKRFSNMLNILNHFVTPFIHNPLVSLYVCEKVPLLNIVGNSNAIAGNNQSPTFITPITCGGLSIDDITEIMKNTEGLHLIYSHLEHTELLEYFVQAVYKESKGFPYFVSHYLLKGNYENCKSREDVDRKLSEATLIISNTYLKPYLEFIDQPNLMKLYHSFICASVLGLEIDEETRVFSASLFEKQELEHEIFKGLNFSNIMQSSSLLYCYHRPVGERKVQLVFPQAVITKYLENMESMNLETYETLKCLNISDEHLFIKIIKFRLAWTHRDRIEQWLPFLTKHIVQKIGFEGKQLYRNDSNNPLSLSLFYLTRKNHNGSIYLIKHFCLFKLKMRILNLNNKLQILSRKLENTRNWS